MNITDETLMAFADGELDAAARAAVEAALRSDPDLEKRVAQHRALRGAVQLAYAAELEQAPPERLLAAARGKTGPGQTGPGQTGLGQAGRGSASGNGIVDLGAARTAAAVREASKSRSRIRVQPWASMAACLVIGVALGFFALRHSSSLIASNGGWVAGGVLAKALSDQLGSERSAAAPVQIGLSFLSKSGDYCRSFTISGAAAPGGVACRHADEWQIRALAQDAHRGAGEESTAGFRTASSPLSPLILQTIQQQMTGDPLDQNGEIVARQRGWQASSP